MIEGSASAPRAAGASTATPLAVDMDGTLLATDVLMEGLALALAVRPLAALAALPSALAGRARLKRRIAALTPDLDVAALPVHAHFLRRLEQERAAGRALHLVTAADQAAAERVAARFGVFDSVMGSDGALNLKADRKLARLRARFPEGFAYAGDSRADLRVWRGATSAIFVGWKRDVRARLERAGPPLEAAFDTQRPRLRDWRAVVPPASLAPLAGALLPWPLFAPDPGALLAALVIAAFATLGARILAAVMRVQEDRQRHRPTPFATGALPLAHGFSLAVGGSLAPAAAAFWLGGVLAEGALLALWLFSIGDRGERPSRALLFLAQAASSAAVSAALWRGVRA